MLSAEKAFAQIDGIQQKINIPERVRSEILNHQAAIFAESRNMEQACTYLEEAVKASVTLGSARRYRESFEIFQRMQTIWGHEQRIKAIGDLFMA